MNRFEEKIIYVKQLESLTKEIKRHISNFGVWNVEFVRKNQSYLLKMLSRDEKRLYDQYGRDKSKTHFLGGRVLLKLCLINVVGQDIPFTDINIKKESNGSPSLFIKNKKSNIYCSISHKEDTIFCAAERFKLAVDVEKVSARLIKIKSKYVSPSEEKIILNAIKLSKVKSEKDILAFYYTQLWSSKESLVKYLGKSLLDVLRKAQLVKIKDHDFLLKYRMGDTELNFISHNFLYNSYAFSIIKSQFNDLNQVKLDDTH